MPKTILRTIVFLVAGASIASQSAHAGVVDSINELANPSSSDWAVPELGWFYTPAFDYALSGIQTKFRTSDGRTVDVQLYEGFTPGSGGTLLRSGSFVPAADDFSGANFAEVGLIAGQSYFVAFRDVSEMGANNTMDNGAVNLGEVYFSIDPADNFSHAQSGAVAQPIIRFLGSDNSVAEPTSVLLLGFGLAALGLFGVRKRQQS